ncbi:B3/4 domain-containing protein [Streptomyces sp. AF1A]|uniref:B3/B4 domain-containing protein n=1 Tax=Streptomyces sp. AF1A TaxID=3394350 RepID=UPI0039BC701A
MGHRRGLVRFLLSTRQQGDRPRPARAAEARKRRTAHPWKAPAPTRTPAPSASASTRARVGTRARLHPRPDRRTGRRRRRGRPPGDGPAHRRRGCPAQRRVLQGRRLRPGLHPGLAGRLPGDGRESQPVPLRRRVGPAQDRQGDRLPRINSLVDLCNAVSLESRLPVASCDVGGIEAEPTVRPARGSEVHLPLGAPDAPEHPEPGEVVYADDQGRAHSRRWNWRQGDLVKSDRGRRRLLLTVESAHEGGRAEVERTLGRLTEALTGLGAAPQPPRILDGATPWVVGT